MANCKFCGKLITWIKEGRKNVPIEDDGGVHECDEFKKAQKSIKRLDRTSLSPEEIARYEKMINIRGKK